MELQEETRSLKTMWTITNLKTLSAILFLVCSFHMGGQEIDSVKMEQIDVIARQLYDSNSFLLKESALQSKRSKDFSFPWSQNFYSRTTLEAYLKKLEKNAEISIENDGFQGNQLTLSSYLPEDQNNSIFTSYDLEIIKSEITNEKNDTIQIGGFKSRSFGYEQQCSSEDKKKVAELCKTIEVNFAIPKLEATALRGTLIWNGKFVSGYSYERITKNNRNIPIILNDLEFTVIDIIDNKIVISHKNKEDLLLNDLSFINIDKNGNKIEAIPYSDYLNSKKRDSLNELPRVANSRHTVQSYNYSVFKNNPDLSFNDYKKMIHKKILRILGSDNPKEMFKKEFGEHYVVISTVDIIENLYFYTPNYVQKECTTQLK
ncbi:MAG: hypothetical protein AAFZ89_08170 [Bacteroidota bacterium]